MLIAEDFQLSRYDLAKALESGGGAPPQGSQPRAGHKYVKRWWDNGKWNYEYAGEGTPHRSQAHHESGEQRLHQLALPEGHQYQPGQEEQAYRETFGQAFTPGQRHEVDHPSPKLAGQKLQVAVVPGHANKPRILVTNQEGKSQQFESPAAYEMWTRQQQAGPEEYADHNGKPFLMLVPNVGNIKGAELFPPTESGPKRRWQIKPAEGADPELVAAMFPKDKRIWLSTKDAAVKAIAERMRYLEQTKGVQFKWGNQGGQAAPTQSPGPAAGAAPSGQAPVEKNPEDASNELVRPDDKRQFSPEQVASIKDPFAQAMAGAGWSAVPNPEKRKFEWKSNLPPEQKEKLLQQAAMALTQNAQIAIRKVALMSGKGTHTKEGQRLQERLFGDIPPQGDKTPWSPEPGSPSHQLLENLIDTYRIPVGANGDVSNAHFLKYADSVLGQRFINIAKEYGAQDKTQEISGGNQSTDTTRNNASQEEKLLTQEGGSPVTATSDDPRVAHESWQKMQTQRLYQLNKEKQLPQGFLDAALKFVKNAKDDNDIDRFAEVMAKYGHREHIMDKALMRALLHMADVQKAQSNPAVPLTRDKKADPSHQYSGMEGDKDHPKFYWQDQQGNRVRYTNAPKNHPDYEGRFGDAQIHPSEPSFDTAAPYFDPNGRKLTRATPDGAQVEWNRSYHPNDPRNLWAGRWVNPVTGEHEHTYFDGDMRNIPRLAVHQANMLADARLPILRQRIRQMYSSSMLKDRIVACALALVDQGHFRAEELCSLSPADVEEMAGIFRLGNRFIYADPKLRSVLGMLTRGRTPNEPLFAIPRVERDGDVDPSLIRRIGPHYIRALLDEFGVSLDALHTYHASQLFSIEVQRLLVEESAPWVSAIEYATWSVAQQLGHNLREEPDLETALPAVREMLIDPVMIEVLQRNAERLGLLDLPPVLVPLPAPAIMSVSMDLTQLTADEQEFSKWLHAYPFHLHAEEANFVAPRRPQQIGPGPKANMDDATPSQPEADPQKPQAQLGSIAS